MNIFFHTFLFYFDTFFLKTTGDFEDHGNEELCQVFCIFKIQFLYFFFFCILRNSTVLYYNITFFLRPALEIVTRVKRVENPPFRPHVPQLIENAETLRDLMKRCWDESADDRPSFAESRKEIEGLMKDNGL